MRQPDVDVDALGDLLTRVLPGTDRASIVRTADGVSTPVYRFDRRGQTLYARVAEHRGASLAPEAHIHEALRARGVLVPEVVHFEPFDAALERSVMVTTEIEGTSVALRHHGIDVCSVIKAAGRDLAAINDTAVAGFGWIKRDASFGDQLAAEQPTLRAFALDDFEGHLAELHGVLTPVDLIAIRDLVSRDGALLDHGRGRLAHGDFDVTHIYHQDGRYTGIIDFGEIRGADRCYDLGHFSLHDGESLPVPMLPRLLAGYREVALPENYERRLRLWSLLIGVRALARSRRRSRMPYQEHLIRAIRRTLAES